MSSLKRAMNKVPAMILRSPLHILMNKSVVLITRRESGEIERAARERVAVRATIEGTGRRSC